LTGIHVALATDAAYLPWCSVLLRSCLDRHPETPLTFHVLHDGRLAIADQQRLAAMVDGARGTVELHTVVDARLQQLPAVDRFGTVVWLRLALPDLLPELSRVLYLDADTFVAGALGPLWATDLGDSPLAAVANVVEPAMHDHVRSLDLNPLGGFFNSGVLLMNLDVMRRESSFDQLVACASDHERLVWPDQDVLNAVFAGRWQPLHPRWNAMNSLWTWPEWATATLGADAVAEATTDPAIVHFEGPSICKPWHYLCRHPWRDEYRRTLATTPWAGAGLTGRTPATRVIRRLPGSWQTPAFVRLERFRRSRRAARLLS
jgi:lipopolysaccharide biosynthesis glycosyltransferase